MSDIKKLEENLVRQCGPLKANTSQMVKELTEENARLTKEKEELSAFLSKVSVPLSTLDEDLNTLASQEATMLEMQNDISVLEKILIEKNKEAQQKLTKSQEMYRQLLIEMAKLSATELVSPFTDIIEKIRNMTVLGQASQTQIKSDQRRQLQDKVLEFESRITKKKSSILKMEEQLEECHSHNITSDAKISFKKAVANEYQTNKNELIQLKLAVHKMGGKIE